MMPNWVMNWIGARMESRVDDASMIQQQTQQFMSTLAYSSPRGGAGSGSLSATQQFQQDSQTLNSMNQAGMANTQQYKDMQTKVQGDYTVMQADQAKKPTTPNQGGTAPGTR